MSKFDSRIINSIRNISINIDDSNNGELLYKAAPIFFELYLKHLNYNIDNPDWVNRDRLVVSNKLLPLQYTCMNAFGYNVSLESLKEYNKFNSLTPAYNDYKNLGIEVSSITNNDIIPSSLGIAYGKKLLNSELLDFKTICICELSDVLSSLSLESLLFLKEKSIKNYILIAFKDTKPSIELDDLCDAYKIDLIEVEDRDSFSGAMDDAKKSKKGVLILVDYKLGKKEKVVVENGELESFAITPEDSKELRDNVFKRIKKAVSKWDKNVASKGSSSIKLLEKGIEIDFSSDKLRMNDNYSEELSLGNTKIFNILKKKSPYILNISDTYDEGMFIKNKTNIMLPLAIGLEAFGYKVFVKTPLSKVNEILSYINIIAKFNIPITLVFTNDSVSNTINNIIPINEISVLRNIPNLITFRPADINEIIGIYEFVSNTKRPVAIIVGSENVPKLLGTDPKYVMAGAYRVRRERGEMDGIIVASGTEVNLALTISEELYETGYDLRVVSMPCMSLFDSQNDRYLRSLLPKSVPIFSLEYSSSIDYYKYVTSKDNIIGINKFSTMGTKEELLNYHNLSKDRIKAKIVEELKKVES